MCTAVISSIPRTGASGTRKPCWKDRSIPSAPFAVLKRQTQFLRTDKDAKNNNRLSPGTQRTCQVGPARVSQPFSRAAPPRSRRRRSSPFPSSPRSALGFVAASCECVVHHARRDFQEFPTCPCATRTRSPARHCRRLRSSIGPSPLCPRSRSGTGRLRCAHGPAVEAETGYAEDRETHLQHVALLSAGIALGDGRRMTALSGKVAA